MKEYVKYMITLVKDTIDNNDIDNLQDEIKSHKDINPNSGHNLICLK